MAQCFFSLKGFFNGLGSNGLMLLFFPAGFLQGFTGLMLLFFQGFLQRFSVLMA